jgi:hypothetical protein
VQLAIESGDVTAASGRRFVFIDHNHIGASFFGAMEAHYLQACAN